MNKSTVAMYVLYGSIGFNVGAIVADLWHGQYAPAALQSVIVAIVSAFVCVQPKLIALLDARLAAAIAERDTAQVVLTEVQRMQQAGALRFGVAASMSSSARPH